MVADVAMLVVALEVTVLLGVDETVEVAVDATVVFGVDETVEVAVDTTEVVAVEDCDVVGEVS